MPTARHSAALALALLAMPALAHAAAAPADPGLPPPFAELGIDPATADRATLATAVARLGYPPLTGDLLPGAVWVAYHTIHPTTDVQLTFLYDVGDKQPFVTAYSFPLDHGATLAAVTDDLEARLGPARRRDPQGFWRWEAAPGRWISVIPTSSAIQVAYTRTQPIGY